MPLDPSIILGVRQPENPVDSIGRAITLRSLIDQRRQQRELGAQHLQENELTIAAKRRADADEQKYRQITAETNGDRAAMLPKLYAAGLHTQAGVLGKQITEEDEKKALTDQAKAHTGVYKFDAAAKQAELGSNTLNGLLEGDDTQLAANLPGAIAKLEKQGVFQPGELAPDATRAEVQAHYQMLTSAKTLADIHHTKQQAQIVAALAPSELAKSKAEATLAENKVKLIQNANPEDYLALVDKIVPPGVKENAALNDRTKAQVEFSLKRGDIAGAQSALTAAASETRQLEIATDPRIAKQKISINLAEAAGRESGKAAAATSGPLTADDYKRSGAEYAITGVMPQLGNGSGAVKQRLLHEKQEFARSNNLTPRDMALAKAAFAGDAKSLEKMVVNRDQIVSFEQAAQKNIDMFLDLASKIPDTRVPWANTPLRMLDEKLAGSANMAAINAARTVANNEVAKLTSGGGLGGVLSDHARAEVDKYNPQSATYAQTVAIVKVLKQDMANRHSSMDNVIEGIRGRAGSFTGTDPAAAGGGANVSKVEKWGFDKSGKLVKQ